VVTRRLWVDTAVADYARERLNYPGLRILARVDCEQRQGGQVLSVETRYFATSLDPERVAVWELLKLIRGHWGVENSLHHIKDRWWDEGRHYTKEPAKGEGMAVLRNAAISILHLVPLFEAEEPIRARADRLNRDADLAIELFTTTFS
jgi:Transposase DDE domain